MDRDHRLASEGLIGRSRHTGKAFDEAPRGATVIAADGRH